MTRKRYKKLMMSIGYKRNVFNKIVTYEICGEMFSKRRYMIDGALFTSYNDLWDWYSQYLNFHTKKFINIDEVARDAIDDYLDFCARVGKEPEKPNV